MHKPNFPPPRLETRCTCVYRNGARCWYATPQLHRHPAAAATTKKTHWSRKLSHRARFHSVEKAVDVYRCRCTGPFFPWYKRLCALHRSHPPSVNLHLCSKQKHKEAPNGTTTVSLSRHVHDKRLAKGVAGGSESPSAEQNTYRITHIGTQTRA